MMVIKKLALCSHRKHRFCAKGSNPLFIPRASVPLLSLIILLAVQVYGMLSSTVNDAAVIKKLALGLVDLVAGM